MRLVFLLCQLGLILRTKAQTELCLSSSTNRPPENSDITVTCGTDHIDLSILLCPVYHANYQETDLVLNNGADNPECHGTVDWNSVPPVITYSFSLDETSTSSCENIFEIIDEDGIGLFSDFSKFQFMNISGFITSEDSTDSLITYSPQIHYKFSCLYPMQYILNNTEMGVSGSNIAIQDSDGTFISSLSMHLYDDEGHQYRLTIPPTGIDLKTRIYVSVEATNLTEKFNVLLDRCYATTSRDPSSKTFYDLFVQCNHDEQTLVKINGKSQTAGFSFEAFRFVTHKDQPISTFYLHCMTKLCEVASCESFSSEDCNKEDPKRRKREVEQETLNTTVSSPAIIVGSRSNEGLGGEYFNPWTDPGFSPKFQSLYDDAQTFSASHDLSPESNYSSPLVAIIVCIVILAILLLAMPACFAFYIKKKKSIMQ